MQQVQMLPVLTRSAPDKGDAAPERAGIRRGGSELLF